MPVILFISPSQVLILFKLILLEKKVRSQTNLSFFFFCQFRTFWKMTLTSCFDFCCSLCWQVLFYVSPVNRLVGALMTVLSLFPGQQQTFHKTPETFMHLLTLTKTELKTKTSCDKNIEVN